MEIMITPDHESEKRRYNLNRVLLLRQVYKFLTCRGYALD